MKIVVCIKQVPRSDSVKIDPKTNNMVRDNVEGVINPFDKNAIEEALRIKDQLGGEVILLSMGAGRIHEFAARRSRNGG